MNTRHIAIRTACLLASTAVTVLVLGSQLGIANGYTQQAETVAAAKRAQQAIAQHAPASSQPRS